MAFRSTTRWRFEAAVVESDREIRGALKEDLPRPANRTLKFRHAD